MSEEEKKFLEIVDLKKGFGSGQTRQEVLRGMNFSVAKGEFCVLLGPSGSGKSTLLNIIGGIDNADSGYININGVGIIRYCASAPTQISNGLCARILKSCVVSVRPILNIIIPMMID